VACRLEHFSLDDFLNAVPKTQLDWDITADGLPIASSPECRYGWGDFVALSYTWGDIKHLRDIVVNGCRVSVWSNLEAALRELRTKRPVREGLMVWVDALCINQNDVRELNEEVKRMRTIYKAARDVVVWLGQEENGSERAIELIKMLSKSCKDGTGEALGQELHTSSDLFAADVWRCFGQFLNRPYWDCLWIMQEIILGNSQTPVLCGNRVVQWGQIFHAVYTFASRHIEIIFSKIEQECDEAGVRYSGLNRNKIIHLWRYGDVRDGQLSPPLMPLFDLSRKSQTADPRDKIYGLLGLLPLEVFNTIQPDYNLEVSEVYISFAKAWIFASKHIVLTMSPNVCVKTRAMADVVQIVK
jgi:hypothetical protein